MDRSLLNVHGIPKGQSAPNMPNVCSHKPSFRDNLGFSARMQVSMPWVCTQVIDDKGLGDFSWNGVMRRLIRWGTRVLLKGVP